MSKAEPESPLLMGTVALTLESVLPWQWKPTAMNCFCFKLKVSHSNTSSLNLRRSRPVLFCVPAWDARTVTLTNATSVDLNNITKPVTPLHDSQGRRGDGSKPARRGDGGTRNVAGNGRKFPSLFSGDLRPSKSPAVPQMQLTLHCHVPKRDAGHWKVDVTYTCT